jgi:hypothetical protein
LGALHIQTVPLETLEKDLLFTASAILSPCRHPFINYLRIPSASVGQEIAPQTLLQERRFFNDFQD